ncbi:MAG: TIGR02453 family protein [Ignavibacteria bacterium]
MLDELVKEPFLGFPKKALKFLKELSIPSNNNKAWFDEHRDIYEENLKKPMRDLIDTLAIEINKIDPDIVVNYKSIFRINRDVRFAKDKRPYKEIYAAAFAFDRIKSAEIPAFYFHFDSKEFLFASGQYSMDNDYLKK